MEIDVLQPKSENLACHADRLDISRGFIIGVEIHSFHAAKPTQKMQSVRYVTILS